MSQSENFLKELYSRLDTINSDYNQGQIQVSKFIQNEYLETYLDQYKLILPADKSAKILDIGVGDGWFASACYALGYEHIELADFGCTDKFSDVRSNLDPIKDIHNIETSITDLLQQEQFHNKYDFIHMSHVLEHVPKYDLIKTMDSLNQSLREKGTIYIRVPNLLGPIPFNYRYTTAGHEYGFVPSNLKQMLLISNFEDIQFHDYDYPSKGLLQIIGGLLRKLYLINAKIKFRLFEGYVPQSVKPELIITGQRTINNSKDHQN